jgi:23S rRNA (guanosine2251-2'-O)-methyltransferase
MLIPMMKTDLICILNNIRSAHNVGSIFRTADAVGAAIWTVGITPYPPMESDTRPPYVASRAGSLLAKTALGAERTVPHHHFDELRTAVLAARQLHYTISALEQAESSLDLFEYAPATLQALVVGTEPTGLTEAELALCDNILEIPMIGQKESLNASVATGIALYKLRKT